MRTTAIVLLVVGCWSAALAQVTLSADRTDILIGDQITVALTIENAEVADWLNPDVSFTDTSTQFVVLGQSEIEQSGQASGIRKSWLLAVFDTGQVVIPPMSIELQRGNSSRTFVTNDIPIMVSGVVDSVGLAPIKEIIKEPAKFTDYLPYVATLVGLLLLIGLIYYWRNRPKKEQEVIEIRDVRPAHQIALDALFELEEKKLWQSGKVKEYHSELSQILRAYIEERFGVPALESTTSDLRVALRDVLQSEHYEEMMRMMGIEDLVKFAKAQPPIEVHAEYLEFVRKFINNTKVVQEVADAE